MENKLAANSIDGVFVCENPSESEDYTYMDMDFYFALPACGTDTLYGLIYDEIAEK